MLLIHTYSVTYVIYSYFMLLLIFILVLQVEYGLLYVFFFKQKTAYEMRISDWSSDVCSSDLFAVAGVNRVLIAIMGRWRASLDFANRKACGEIGRASCRERVCQYV